MPRNRELSRRPLDWLPVVRDQPDRRHAAQLEMAAVGNIRLSVGLEAGIRRARLCVPQTAAVRPCE